MTLPEIFYVPLERDLLRITGRDRQSFLQGMVTNDVAALTPGQGCYAFHLTSKGQILADCRIACLDDSLLIDTEPGWGEPLAQSLEHHLVMERAKIAPLTGIFTTFVGGTEAEAALAEFGLLPAPGEGSSCTQNIQGAIVTAVRAHWVSGSGVALYTTAEALPTLYAAGEPLALEIFEGLRIEAGIPRGRIDFDEKTLALETGQAARAIHYKKGCYIGQEIVARLDARGHTNRSLVQLTCDRLFPPRTPILFEGSDVGWVTSCALGPSDGQPVALGYVRNAAGAPGTKVQLGESGAGVVR